MKRSVLIGGLIFLQLLLMGAAFVGGRMLGEQNRRAARPAGGMALPSQLPKDPAAGNGTVQKIQDTTITLGRGFGGPPGGANASAETQVTVTADTKYYKNAASGNPGMPGGQTAIQVQNATMADIKIGNRVMVWGVKTGERIAAEVVYIQ